jgi:protein-tyrosine phosphatase
LLTGRTGERGSMRTSETDPLRVDFLAAADLGLPGRLGLTLAPGKKDPTVEWDRDLESDLERLRDHYKVDRLVSLMEPHEYRFLKIADLSERASNHGIAVCRFPIPDVDAPPATSMSSFLALVRTILNDVDAGRTVIIHCRGGIGRSGLVAASCLVALGHPPREAIELVRSARPGAVEVTVQEEWVEAVAERLESETASWWRDKRGGAADHEA